MISTTIGHLRRAKHVCVLTGAGVSAESGVPTFREAQSGLWAHYKPQELATAEAFQANPDQVWKWYEWRRKLVSQVSPNPGHVALAHIASLVRRFTLITQNVDGLHQRAGSEDVIEFHGNLFRNRCFAGNCDVSTADMSTDAPVCPNCQARIRPDVVWFGEQIPVRENRLAAQAAAQCDLFFSVGTSALVWPAAGLADLARANDAKIVEINVQPTPIAAFADVTLQGESGQILPELAAGLSSRPVR